MGGNRNDDAMGTLDIGEGIVALADLGDRRGEKGILEPRISLLQFLHDGHRLVNRHHRYRLIPGILGMDESVVLHENADKRPSSAPSVRSDRVVIFTERSRSQIEVKFLAGLGAEGEAIIAFRFQETPSHHSFHRFP